MTAVCRPKHWGSAGWTIELGRLVVALALPATVWIAACGSDALDAPGGDGMNARPGGGVSCATPDLGCPCTTPGQVVACGKEIKQENDFLYCYQGNRTCDAMGTWGDCLDGSIHTRSVPALSLGQLSTLTVGAQGVCPPGTDPCDPYCFQQTDDPIGLVPPMGFTVTPGGLTVTGSGPVGPGTFQVNGNGDSGCGGAVNVHTAPCFIAGAIDQSKCQQDWRCDVPTNTCVWNGGVGYFDPTAGGIDLTIGAGCDFAAAEIVPLCNRGSAPVPANTIIGVNITNAVENGCTAVHAVPDCVVNVGAAGLPPGQCTNVLGCAVSGNKNAVVNASGRDIAEAPGRCANNASAVKATGAPGCAACQACDTSITGKVFDPSGATPAANANDVGLANIQVFQPTTTLTALVDNPAAGPPPCDSCASLASPSFAQTLSSPDGTFTLHGVVPGPAQTVVVQTGRWRRQFSVGPITACNVTALTNGTARLPKNRTDGLGGVADIPKTALNLGDGETLECLLRRIGISDSEFTAATAVANPQRFHVYRSNGMQMSPTPAPSSSLLYQAGGRVGAYTSVIGSCDFGAGAWNAMTSLPAGSSDRDRMKSYTDAGGHLFIDHRLGEAFLLNGIAPWNGPAVATWDGPANAIGTVKAKIDNVSGPQMTFFQFMTANNTFITYGSPFIEVDSPAFEVFTTGPASVEFVRGVKSWTAAPPDEWTTIPAGDHALSMSFDTPTTSPPASQCGRVVFNSMHVSQARQPTYPSGPADTFPTSCTGYPGPGGGLSDEELALEYQLFQLTACALSPPPPPPPPPPPSLPASITFPQDFQATCPIGTHVQWQLFEWQSIVPLGTSIAFRAATASTAAGLPLTVAPAPVTVSAGTATTTTGPTWTFDTGPGPMFTPQPVSFHLKNDPPGPAQVSSDFLRIFMTFNTNLIVAPTLVTWRQLYDCVPAE